MSFREDIDAMNAQFVADWEQHDAAACAAVYTEDATYLASGIDPAQGRAAIRATFAAAMEAGYELTRLTTTSAESDGALGYAVQSFESNAGGGTILLVFRRDGQGAWKVCAEAGVAM